MSAQQLPTTKPQISKPFLTVAEMIEYLKTQDQNAIVFTNQCWHDFTEILPIDPTLSWTAEKAVLYTDEAENQTRFQSIDSDTEQEVVEEISEGAENSDKLMFWGTHKILVLNS